MRLRRAFAWAVTNDAAKWLVIDGYNLVYKSFHALPRLTHDGAPTGAISGFANSLLRHALPYARRGSRIVFAVEGRSSWRREIAPEYKATRERMPSELRPQLGPILDLAAGFGARVVSVEGQEADDVIATIATRHREEGVDIWSEDKDLHQVIGPTVRVVRAKGVVGVRDVERIHGVTPDLLPAFFALVGDKSDNVAGIHGVGPKTAAKLLNAFGTLEAVLEGGPNAPTIGPAMRQRLANADKDLVFRSRRLVTLNTTVDLPPDYYSDGVPSRVDFDALLTLADAYGLIAFKKKLQLERNAWQQQQQQQDR
ncbi:hypothetical protein CTAYLR_005413 [Chrysophaeum taylorii]|uniref:5'-3' exonuclease domain-containing protein n=1 Tax=Chrysophaeum taylorii TaxID=2483200 RepID=A0AAD7U894_9STRA|nr:hypothetical protein CTAYLR_005413 [Chrysophaeum taylorii]